MSLAHERDNTQAVTDHDSTAFTPSLISISIRDPLVLQRCYLPFFLRGGLFIPCDRSYRLQQRLFLIVKLPALPDAPDTVTTHGGSVTVAWLTPAQAQGNKRMGIGVHFDAGEADLKHSIESLLNALL
ncbi:MAG: pilus assembly protein PilZ [Pseudohongiella sp.]